MSAVEATDAGWRALADPRSQYIFCANERNGVCNWLVRADGNSSLCESCRRNRIIPDLSIQENLERWRRIELAKRYVFRSVMRWRLPAPDRVEDPQGGLAFDLLGDVTRPDGSVEVVRTGHADGLITLNIAEADDPEREIRRSTMGETYRTLIGHFRHEIGHFYWDRLVRDAGRLAPFRTLFGDERQDYQAALQHHYDNGPPPQWQDAYISAYATAHPWEDFAETWAHYIHIVDALETGRSYGINISANFRDLTQIMGPDFEPYSAHSVDELIRAWTPLTVAINGVNRSMGQPDLYPFVLSTPVIAKLEFIHDTIRPRRKRSRNNSTMRGFAYEDALREAENVETS